MSALKQIVKNALEIKNASPQILASVDTLLQRSVTRLQNDDLLPPRTWEFTCSEEKQEKRNGDDLLYNFFYLPKDFRRLESFRPMKTNPYNWQRDEHELYQKLEKDHTETELEKLTKEFTIVNTNSRDDSGYEKILIAYPFPPEDETIEIKYWLNGQTVDFDWIDGDYWEAIIADIEEMVGLRPEGSPETERRVSNAVERHKETQSREDKRTLGGGTFFGKRSRNLLNNNSINKL